MALSRLGPVVHIIAGLIPLAWIHMATGGSLRNPPNLGLALLCAMLALLPDIDSHASLLGRFLPEISRYIERHYGHRTITHSIAANLVVGVCAYTLAPDWLPLTLAYASHLLIDMIVGGNAGVPLFWPAPWRFKLMHVAPASRGELVIGALALALALLPFATPRVASQAQAMIPRQPTPTPTKTPAPTPTPAPTLVVVRVAHVYHVESEILVQAGDVITTGQLLADLHTLRAQIRAHQVLPSPTPTVTVAFRSGPKRQLATVNVPSINIRSGPGTDNPIVGAASQGQTFAVIGQQAGWVQVAHEAGAAWLFGELLTLTTEGDAIPPTPAPVDPLKMSSAWADLQLARAIATQAFAPPDPDLLSACHSRLESMRNDLWQAQLARDAAKVKANEPGASTPWETIRALEAGLFERERQIAEQELECRQLASQPYAQDDFARQIAAARLQQAEIDYLQKIATSTPRPTATATPTPTPRPTQPPPDYSDTYVASLIAGDVYAVEIVQVNGNEATVEIRIAIGYGQPDPAAPSLAGDAPLTVVDSGAISAAFTRSEVDIEELLIARITAAHSRIDVAAFEFDLDSVAEALLDAHRRGVEVRWVTDDEYGLGHDNEPGHGQFGRLAAAGIPVRSDAGTALMHNKFWIFDNQTVWTGSTNITFNGTQRNNNNVLIFDSAAVAEIYTREFEEMWAGQFGAGSPSRVGAQAVELDGAPVEILFGPEDQVADRLTQLILDAQDNIKFMAFSFTHDGMGAALQQKAQELGAVQGIFEARSSTTEHSELTRLHCQSSAEIRTDGNPAIMHHKVIIIDEFITVAGSFNFSANADENNDENLVIVQSEEIAQAYLAEFARRWQEANNPTGECN